MALDVRVLIFTLALSVLTGIVFGLAPAIVTTRSNLAGIMKDRARNTSGGAGRKTLRGALVITQVALAFVLLTGAGLLIRSFFADATCRPGIRFHQRGDCRTAHPQ